jgi:AP-1-like factor
MREPSPIPGPQVYSPSSFQAALASGHSAAIADREITHRIVFSEGTGERLLGTGATWDLIQSHKDYKAGRIDLGSVCERLKLVAVCDGLGPAYRESEIRRAIEDSVVGPGDELI